MSKAIAQIVKQATNVKAAAAPVKKASKPAAKSVQPKTAKPPFACSIVYGQPERGHDLFTYTAAWMEITGFMNGALLDKRVADRIAGSTAINYHIKRGRLAKVDGMVQITEGGKAHFAERAGDINAIDKAAWIKILTTGKADGRLVKFDKFLMPW